MQKYCFVVYNKNFVNQLYDFLSKKDMYGNNFLVVHIDDFKKENYIDFKIIYDEFSKKDALIIDMVGNYLRHGLPSNPKVRKPKDKQEKKEKKEKGQNVCPECFEIVEGDETICPNCGAIMIAKKESKEINEKVRLKEIEEEKKRHRVERFGEKNTITKQGNEGIRFWIKVTGRDLPLFKFCGNGTSKIQRTRDRLNRLNIGDAVDIVNTAYGDWVV
jgi:DNA-directed RNA polymerase subunit M/transcription elongation factor TFIIS